MHRASITVLLAGFFVFAPTLAFIASDLGENSYVEEILVLSLVQIKFRVFLNGSF